MSACLIMGVPLQHLAYLVPSSWQPRSTADVAWNHSRLAHRLHRLQMVDGHVGDACGPPALPFMPLLPAAPPRLQIAFRDLRYTVAVKEKGTKGRVSKEVLRGLSGVIHPGRLTFVM